MESKTKKTYQLMFYVQQPESFFYINIYFSNRFLIQLIMENIPNFKNAKLLDGVKKARQLLFLLLVK